LTTLRHQLQDGTIEEALTQPSQPQQTLSPIPESEGWGDGLSGPEVEEEEYESEDSFGSLPFGCGDIGGHDFPDEDEDDEDEAPDEDEVDALMEHVWTPRPDLAQESQTPVDKKPAASEGHSSQKESKLFKQSAEAFLRKEQWWTMLKPQKSSSETTRHAVATSLLYASDIDRLSLVNQYGISDHFSLAGCGTISSDSRAWGQPVRHIMDITIVNKQILQSVMEEDPEKDPTEKTIGAILADPFDPFEIELDPKDYPMEMICGITVQSGRLYRLWDQEKNNLERGEEKCRNCFRQR
jgi:hypothetical protein